jgi:hypothetical protein
MTSLDREDAALADTTAALFPPRDAYGPDYVIHLLREHFEDLRCLIGFEAARQEVAEIINDSAERKPRHGDR